MCDLAWLLQWLVLFQEMRLVKMGLIWLKLVANRMSIPQAVLYVLLSLAPCSTSPLVWDRLISENQCKMEG